MTSKDQDFSRVTSKVLEGKLTIRLELFKIEKLQQI